MPAQQPPSRPRSHAAWTLAAAAVAIVAILAGTALYVFWSARRMPGEMVEGSRRAVRELREVAAAFRTGTITTSFRSYATEVRGTTRLQFAELREVEVFERRDEAAILWGTLRLPEVVVEARAPVTYIYFVDFQKEWRFRLEDQDVSVLAPAIEWNRPSVDVSALRYEVRAGSAFRDEELVVERLRDELTGLAALRSRQRVPLVRETARRQVEAFVLTWLVQGFSDGTAHRVRVRFADEPEPPSPRAPALPSPAG